MSKDNSGVAWAKKMSDVLGGVNRQDQQAVNTPGDNGTAKAPPTGGTAGGKPAAGDSPAAGGGAPKGGGAKSGGAPTGGGAPTSTAAPTGGGPGGGGPAGGGAPTGSGGGTPAAPATGPDGKADTSGSGGPASRIAGSTAKEHAEAAQKSQADVEAKLAQAKTADAEFKKHTTDAQAGKKQVDDAKQKAEAAEKAIPAGAPVAAPQGKDDKAKYDSAIQITGNSRKVQQDAEAKESEVHDQEGVAQEGVAKVDSALQNAKSSATKFTQLAEHAQESASAASEAASSAKSEAAKSKQKADQAVKDKSADKDALVKAASEDAKYAAAAQDAATKAQAAHKQVAALAANAETQSKAIEKLNQESKTTSDAVKQKAAGIQQKLEPHVESVGKAEDQEAQCKAKLSEGDAESVLEKRYIELGGDPELTKAMADEDKEFETHVERFRVSQTEWQKRKTKELDDYKAKIEGVVKDGEPMIAESSKFLDKEQPLADQASSDAKALDKKLETEPGKELMHEIKTRSDRVARVKQAHEYNKKIVEKTKATLEVVKQRYEDVKKQHDAGEKLVKDTRIELDNILEMENMSLERKVDHLQTRPKPVRDRIQKQLEAEITRLNNISILQTQGEQVEFEPQKEKVELQPIDWKPVQEKLAKLKATSLEDLKKDDPKLADIQKEYDQAGGDPALLEKRVATWKETVAAVEESKKERADDYRGRSEKLREQYTAAEANAKQSEANYKDYTERLADRKARYEELGKKADPGDFFKNFTSQERAEYKLLEREIKRLEIQLKNIEAERNAAKSSRDSAEKLVESERARFDQTMDPNRNTVKKPTSEEIHAMPLRAKYTELTGKQAPAGA